jgi:hypothetical protein
MNKGRVIILGGTPRAGKTTLAVRLAHNGFGKISFDSLYDALQKGYPEIQIADWTDQELCAQKNYPFFEALVGSAVSDAEVYGTSTVFDMYDFTPEYVSKLTFQQEIEAYYLGYPDFSVDEIQHNIKFYAQPTDWIAQVDDDYLTVVARRCFLFNKKLVQQCEQYGYPLINMGAGADRTAALDALFHRIMG